MENDYRKVNTLDRFDGNGYVRQRFVQCYTCVIQTERMYTFDNCITSKTDETFFDHFDNDIKMYCPKADRNCKANGIT